MLLKENERIRVLAKNKPTTTPLEREFPPKLE